MKSETEENFWKAWAEPIPEPAPIFFRLYYDEIGRPLSYSMEDLPGNYIDIDAETFALAPYNVRVVDGKLRYITVRTSNKLVPSPTGTQCHPQSVAVVVKQNGTHWSKQTYGLESN